MNARSPVNPQVLVVRSPGMCGRYALEPTDKFYNRFHIENRLDTLVPRYNIAPAQEAPVVVSKSPNKVTLMKWGLIPHWAKEAKIGYKMINARIETLKEKPSYRGSLKSRRCLVPASGFYEWRASDEGKVPYYIHEKHYPLFGFAGLYDVWKNEEGKEIYSFTIITREADAFMSKIHNRMPAILSEAEENAWLDKSLVDADAALRLLDNCRKSELDAYPISKDVNKPENDYPTIMARLEAEY